MLDKFNIVFYSRTQGLAQSVAVTHKGLYHLGCLHSQIRACVHDHVSPCFQVGANAGIIGMTKEHLGLALALQVPVFVVVTKIDMCPGNVLEDTLKLLQRILKSPGCRKMPVLVQNKDDVVCSATNFSSER